MGPAADAVHAFTVRVDQSVHAAAKAYAALSGLTLSDLVDQALREFLVNHSDADEVEQMAERARTQYREAVERLRPT